MFDILMLFAAALVGFYTSIALFVFFWRNDA